MLSVMVNFAEPPSGMFRGGAGRQLLDKKMRMIVNLLAELLNWENKKNKVLLQTPGDYVSLKFGTLVTLFHLREKSHTRTLAPRSPSMVVTI